MGIKIDDLSGWKRIRAKRKAKYEYFKKINKQYNLNIPDNALYDNADKYAKDYYRHLPAGNPFAWAMQGVAVVVSIVIAVVSIVGAPFTGGSSLVMGSVAITNVLAIGTAISSVASIAIMAVQNKAMNKAIDAEIDKAKQRDRKTFKEGQKAQAKEQLTSTIIYGKYDIYAQNQLYLKGAPGDTNSYNSATTYDCNAGMNGELPSGEDYEIGEDLAYRGHIDKAGNAGYMQSALEADFPLHDKGLDYDLFRNNQECVMNHRRVEMNKGYDILRENDYGFAGTMQDDYDRTYNTRIKPLQEALKSAVFLQEMQSYSKGREHEWAFCVFSTEEENKQSSILAMRKLAEEWDSEESRKLRAELSIEELIRVVFSMRYQQLDLFLMEAGDKYLVRYKDTYILKKFKEYESGG